MKKTIYRYCLLLAISPCAYSITLQQAQEAALASNAKLKSADSLYEAAEKEKQANRAALFPKLSVQYEKVKNQGSDSTSAQQNSMVEVRADIKNPFSHHALQGAQDLEQKDIQLSKEEQRNQILHKTRLAYFKVGLIDLQLNYAKNTLQSRKKELDIVKRKSEGNLLSSNDKERVEREFNKQKQKIDILELKVAAQYEVIEQYIQYKVDRNTLETPFPTTFTLPDLPPQQRGVPISAKKIEVEREKGQNLLYQERMKWTPDFFGSYQKGRREGELDTEAFLLGFTWNVSAAPYFKQRAISFRIQSAEFLYAQEVQDQKDLVTKAFQELKETLATLKSQKDIISSSEKIVKESLRQHDLGGIPLRTYQEDFETWTHDSERELELRYQAVEKLAELSLLTEDEHLFYKGLK